MIATVFDFLFFFIASFLCAYGTFVFMADRGKKSDEEESSAQRLNRRLKILSRQQDELLESANTKISTFMKTDNQFSDVGDIGHNTIIDRVRAFMKKEGLTEMSVGHFLIFCGAGGVAMSTVILYFHFLNALTGIPVGMFIGGYLVFNFLKMRVEQKKTLFLQQFPDAIDMMIRGVKAGLNIGRIMKLVSIEAKDPVAAEYKIISQKMDLGVAPEQVLLDAADRINLEEFRFLVVALILQMENGGMLGDILANLSGIVRKRLELGLKLKAMSAEARMSAIVLSALPFAFAGIMAVLNPAHLTEFTKPGSGQTLLKIMIVLFSTGLFTMIKATKIKV